MVRKGFFQTICLLLFQIGSLSIEARNNSKTVEDSPTKTPLVKSDQHTYPKMTFLLDWWPNPNHVPIFVAQELNLFHKHGIDVELVKINDAPDVISYISMKRADIGLYYMPQAFVAAEKTPLRMIAPYIDVPLQGFLMREECTEPKTVGGFPCALFPHFVDHLEMKPKTVFLHGDLAFNLHARTVDAVFGVYKNIEVHQLEAQGIKTRFISPSDLGIPPFAELVFVIHKESQRYIPFLNAIRESIEYCKTHPKEAFELYARSNPDKTKSVLEWERKAWDDTLPLLSTTLQFDTKQVNDFLEWLQTRNIVSKKRSVSDFFTIDLRDASIRDLPKQELLAPPQSERPE